MRLCLLQLARLGDIFQTAPAINAYKRINPEHHITLIVRNKFAEAAQLLTHVDKIIELPSAFILKPLVQDQADTNETIERLEGWLNDIRQNQFDKIVNLSFSPLTSWLTAFLQQSAVKDVEICGYSRTSDGYLAIPDDMSAYVYAQVGWDRSNRFHLNEIFGTLMGVDLEPQDWNIKSLKPFILPTGQTGDYLTIQVQASSEDKSIPAQKISVLLNQLKTHIQTPVVLLGSTKDQETAEMIVNSTSYPFIINLVGKTSLTESAAIIKQATLLLAPDSSLQNLASLTQTITLLVACGPVNFWETGPRKPGSMVLNYALPEDINVDELTQAVASLMNHTLPTTVAGYVSTAGNPCYQPHFLNVIPSFSWLLIKAIYQGADLPATMPGHFVLAIEKLNDVNQFTIEVLEQIQNGASLKEKAPFLERANEIMMAIYDLCFEIKPVIDWFNTEKLRIGPGSDQEVLVKTLACHRLLNELCQYVFDQNKSRTEVSLGDQI